MVSPHQCNLHESTLSSSSQITTCQVEVLPGSGKIMKKTAYSRATIKITTVNEVTTSPSVDLFGSEALFSLTQYHIVNMCASTREIKSLIIMMTICVNASRAPRRSHICTSLKSPDLCVYRPNRETLFSLSFELYRVDRCQCSKELLD